MRKPERKSALGRPSLRYGNITTDLKEVEWECMEQISMAKNVAGISEGNKKKPADSHRWGKLFP